MEKPFKDVEIHFPNFVGMCFEFHANFLAHFPFDALILVASLRLRS